METKKYFPAGESSWQWTGFWKEATKMLQFLFRLGEKSSPDPMLSSQVSPVSGLLAASDLPWAGRRTQSGVALPKMSLCLLGLCGRPVPRGETSALLVFTDSLLR